MKTTMMTAAACGLLASLVSAKVVTKFNVQTYSDAACTKPLEAIEAVYTTNCDGKCAYGDNMLNFKSFKVLDPKPSPSGGVLVYDVAAFSGYLDGCAGGTYLNQTVTTASVCTTSNKYNSAVGEIYGNSIRIEASGA